MVSLNNAMVNEVIVSMGCVLVATEKDGWTVTKNERRTSRIPKTTRDTLEGVPPCVMLLISTSPNE